jgi:hypothetical protein
MEAAHRAVTSELQRRWSAASGPHRLRQPHFLDNADRRDADLFHCLLTRARQGVLTTSVNAQTSV